MRIIARKTLSEYWMQEPEAEADLKAWFAEVQNAEWSQPADLKEQYRNASILKDCRVVFNICGNKHRLVVRINYQFKVVYIRFIGTHKEYDAIDIGTI